MRTLFFALISALLFVSPALSGSEGLQREGNRMLAEVKRQEATIPLPPPRPNFEDPLTGLLDGCRADLTCVTERARIWNYQKAQVVRRQTETEALLVCVHQNHPRLRAIADIAKLSGDEPYAQQALIAGIRLTDFMRSLESLIRLDIERLSQ